MTGTITRTIAGQAFPTPGNWQFDIGHSRVAFEARHLMVTKVRGGFTEFSGTIQIGEEPEQSFAELTIAAASLSSGLKDRDDHLKSADFLDVARYPTVTFRSTSLRHYSGARWEAAGDLTIRDVTRPVVLVIEFSVESPTRGATRRSDFPPPPRSTARSGASCGIWRSKRAVSLSAKQCGSTWMSRRSASSGHSLSSPPALSIAQRARFGYASYGDGEG